MWSSLKSLLKSDIKSVLRDPILLITLLSPFLLIFFLIVVFPIISEFVFSKKGFYLNSYYSVIAITIISIFPVLIGFLYALKFIDKRVENNDGINTITPVTKQFFLKTKIIIPSSLSLILLLLSVSITDPVPTQGWLRSIYISLALAVQTPFAFLFIAGLSNSRLGGIALAKVFGIFLAAIPFGLLVHHPWTYFAFYSPFYWLSWAWVIPSPLESLLYGVIALILTLSGVVILFRHFLRKHTN